MDVVPRRAEEYDHARGLIVDVLAAYTSVQCHPAKPATSLYAVGHLQEVIVGFGKVAAPASIEGVIVVIKCSCRAHENIGEDDPPRRHPECARWSRTLSSIGTLKNWLPPGGTAQLRDLRHSELVRGTNWEARLDSNRTKETATLAPGCA